MMMKKASDCGYNKRRCKFQKYFQKSPLIVFRMNTFVPLVFILASTLAFEYDYYGDTSYDYGDGNNYDFEYDPSKYEIKSSPT